MSRTLSPLSVPYRVFQRGSGVLVALAFVALGGGLPTVGPAGPLVLLAFVGVAAIGLVGYEVTYVRRFSYELSGDTLDIESGVFSRRSREIPIRRIQNVDISRNVLQRLLGIALVSFETAGGGETEARLRFVSFEEAKRLQGELGRLKRREADEGRESDSDEWDRDSDAGAVGETGAGGGVDSGTGAAAGVDGERDGVGREDPGRVGLDEPERTELFALDRNELAILGALSIDLRVPGLLFLAVSTLGSTVVSGYLSVVPGVALVIVAAVLVVAVALVSWVVGAAAAIVEYYDFRLVRAGDELQYERGLLQRYDGSIPFEKIQTLTIAENPLKRRFGYATLYIETAGYAPGSSGGSRGSEAAIPIAEREHVLELVETLEPVGDVDLERPPKRARERYLVRYLLVVGALFAALFAARSLLSLSVPWWPPLLLVPVALAYAHAAWLNRGHWLGDHHVVTRNGVLRRETKIVPYYRIQTIIDSRTVFQRRRDLATVTIDTAGSLSLGGQDAAAVDVAGERADELREGLEARLDRAVEAYRAGRAGVGIRDRYDSEAADSTADGATADETETTNGTTADESAAEDSETGDSGAGDGSAADPHDS